eukprot:TRINITY_DN132_c1_g1_i1.p1 TRINITY_DN132_c1_g1~~TRINITY_DN132_c1_g1_i1.p1  ORF type:complete len:503 (+),score=62.51 TRINITY_DN132_c1_g1_i1:178-1686(+)
MNQFQFRLHHHHLSHQSHPPPHHLSHRYQRRFSSSPSIVGPTTQNFVPTNLFPSESGTSHTGSVNILERDNSLNATRIQTIIKEEMVGVDNSNGDQGQKRVIKFEENLSKTTRTISIGNLGVGISVSFGLSSASGGGSPNSSPRGISKPRSQSNLNPNSSPSLPPISNPASGTPNTSPSPSPSPSASSSPGSTPRSVGLNYLTSEIDGNTEGTLSSSGKSVFSQKQLLAFQNLNLKGLPPKPNGPSKSSPKSPALTPKSKVNADPPSNSASNSSGTVSSGPSSIGSTILGGVGAGIGGGGSIVVEGNLLSPNQKKASLKGPARRRFSTPDGNIINDDIKKNTNSNHPSSLNPSASADLASYDPDLITNEITAETLPKPTSPKLSRPSKTTSVPRIISSSPYSTLVSTNPFPLSFQSSTTSPEQSLTSIPTTLVVGNEAVDEDILTLPQIHHKNNEDSSEQSFGEHVLAPSSVISTQSSSSSLSSSPSLSPSPSPRPSPRTLR